MPNPRQDEPSATGFKAVDKAAENAEAAAREAAEAVQAEARSFTDKAAAGAREATEAAAAAVDTAAQAIPDPEAVSRTTHAVAARMREFSSEWLQAWRDQTSRSLEGVARLAECRTPLDVVRLQSELARQNLNDTVSLAKRLNSASLKALGAIAQDSAKATTSVQQQPPAR